MIQLKPVSLIRNIMFQFKHVRQKLKTVFICYLKIGFNRGSKIIGVQNHLPINFGTA